MNFANWTECEANKPSTTLPVIRKDMMKGRISLYNCYQIFSIYEENKKPNTKPVIGILVKPLHCSTTNLY